MNKQIYRSSTDRIISGVLGGIAEYFGISSSILRVLFVVLAIFADALFFLAILYALGAVFIPLGPVGFRSSSSAKSQYGPANANRDFFGDKIDFMSSFSDEKNKTTIGAALILLGIFFLINTVFAIPREYILAVVLILLGVYIIFQHDKGGK